MLVTVLLFFLSYLHAIMLQAIELLITCVVLFRPQMFFPKVIVC